MSLGSGHGFGEVEVEWSVKKMWESKYRSSVMLHRPARSGSPTPLDAGRVCTYEEVKVLLTFRRQDAQGVRGRLAAGYATL